MSASSSDARLPELVERLRREVVEPPLSELPEPLAPADVRERAVNGVRRAARSEDLARCGNEIELEIEGGTLDPQVEYAWQRPSGNA